MNTRDVKLSFPNNSIKKFTLWILTLCVTILTSFQENDPYLLFPYVYEMFDECKCTATGGKKWTLLCIPTKSWGHLHLQKKKKKDHARLRLGVEYCFYLFYLGYLWRVACIPLHIICHLEIWLTKDMFGAMTASAFWFMSEPEGRCKCSIPHQPQLSWVWSRPRPQCQCPPYSPSSHNCRTAYIPAAQGGDQVWWVSVQLLLLPH